MSPRLGIISRDIWALRREVGRCVAHDPVRIMPGLRPGCDAVLAWAGPRGALARRLARLWGVPHLSLSIGPLAGLRPTGEPPTSLVVSGTPRSGGSGAGIAADAAFRLLRDARLAWRNDGRDGLPEGLAPGGFALVLVRTREDDVVARASRDNPGATLAVVADAHAPEDLAAKMAALVPGTRAVVGRNPWALIEGARRVYGSGPDLALLARLSGRDTQCAQDEDPLALFREAWLETPVYFDAWSRKPTDFATAIDQLAFRRARFLENDARSHCVGVSRWKRRQVGRFLDGPDGPAVFHDAAGRAVAAARRDGGRVVAWETRMPATLPASCREAGVPLLRMEDGFLRSVGLGAAFLPGASAVLDGRGIYYDPGVPSDLEHILATASFPDALVARAADLRRRIVALRLSKYNVGRAAVPDERLSDREIVLVPGQVEDDASILLGSRRVAGNLALLRAVRERHPDGYLIYKPHPDVEAGLRRGVVDPAEALRHADRVASGVGIADLLDRVDRVETMTSLAGFEALLRGKAVATHGQPFYAGWGLTEDLDPPHRRTRRLALDELVAGALILYPRSIDPRTGLACPPEVLVGRLAEGRTAAEAGSRRSEALRSAYVRARHALLTPLGRSIRRWQGALRSRAPGR